MTDSHARTLLNVGSGGKGIALPPHYDGWVAHYLDIDPAVSPDILCDARRLGELDGGAYDAVYCSHNLEHYYRHETLPVLNGFRHMLKPDGFVELMVPDLEAVMRQVTRQPHLDLEEKLYDSPAGPITALDVIYGWGRHIAKSGVDFYAHKTGFTLVSLRRVLEESGFPVVYTGAGSLEIRAIAFTAPPSAWHRRLLGLTAA
jgi:hypothetical protein